MAAHAGDDDFDEYDKPGAERSRRRRGEDDLDSDLEEDLLEEDWTNKKNPSELSDEELNDDLLQSDEEEGNGSSQDAAVSLNATAGLSSTFDGEEESFGGDAGEEEGYGGAEGEQEYAGDYEGNEASMEYSGEQAGGDGAYLDEVLDLQIDEPLDDEFQVNDYSAGYGEQEMAEQSEQPEEAAAEEQEGEAEEQAREEEEEQEQDQDDSQPFDDGEEAENEPEQEDEEEDTKEESDDEDDDDEESGRLRFKTERKDATVVRLSDVARKRRNIPETLELSEEAKANLREMEERERQRKFGFRGRGGRGGPGGRGGGMGMGMGLGMGMGMGGRGMPMGGRGGGRGGFPNFGMGDFRGDLGGGRGGRMNDQRPPLMHLGMQNRMPLPHLLLQQQQQQQQRPSGPRGGPGGGGGFLEVGEPLAQQPLQPLLPPHLSQRSPLRSHLDAPQRMLSPQGHPHSQQQQQHHTPPQHQHQHQHHHQQQQQQQQQHQHLQQQHHQQHRPQQQQQQQQPKNIHINPHFRGPSSSPVQVPLVPPTQNQPRPAVGPQRFPGPADFQQHHPGNFGQPQRPPHPPEPWRGPPPPHQDREPFFLGEPRFPGQHLFDQPNPSLLMNNNNNAHPMPGQGPLSFPQPGQGPGGPGFGPLGPGQGQGPLGALFQREPPPRQGLPPQHGGPPGPPGPRAFMGNRQPFPPQQGPPFNSQHMPFGLQVRQRTHTGGLMGQPQLLDSPLHQPLHQQQHHRQDQGPPHQHQGPPQQHQHQPHPGDPLPLMHLGPQGFRQQQQQQQHMHGGPRQMQHRPQNQQQGNAHNRPRMTPPSSIQQVLSQRNSNLRELPIAQGNFGNNSSDGPSHPPQSPNRGGHQQQRPMGRGMQGISGHQGPNMQNTRGAPGGRGQGSGRGQGMGRGQPAPERTVVNKAPTETPPAQTTQVDPNEDEETRQYRLKLEEQKRLREKILKQKEERRQMQAGMRKRELLQRINAQNAPNAQNQTPNQPPQQQQPQHPQQPPPQQQQKPPPTQQAPQTPQQIPALPSNGAQQTQPSIPTVLRPNVKTRLQMAKPQAQAAMAQQNSGPSPNQQGQWQQQQQLQQQQQQQQQLQLQQRRGMNHQNTQGLMGSMPRQGTPMDGSLPGQPQATGPRPGGKRTVMQRQNNTGSPQLPQKVRVVKLSAGGVETQDAVVPAEQPQPIGRLPAQPRQLPIRKVTIGAGGQQQQPPPQQQQHPPGQGGRGHAQPNRVVMAGRGGRGRGARGGRVIATRQSARAQDERSTVSIEGLSTSTTEKQLRNLLQSIGPIQMFEMVPQQRKAIAKFISPQHAQSFQHSFHRHMIDLSHIDVSIIDG